jgi:hypothetical protein
MENDIPSKRNPNVSFIYDNADLKSKLFGRDKEDHCILIKGTINQ